MFARVRDWFRRRWYREGQTLSRFLARDIRRDIVIVSAARLGEGFLTVRIRTINVLYVSHGLMPVPEFELAKEIPLAEIWRWSSQSWGGPPEGPSLVE